MLLRFQLLLIGSLSVLAVAAQDVPRQETVGTLDFFGLRTVTEAEVRAALRIKEGDAFQRSSVPSLVEYLRKIPRVAAATVAPITVDGTGQLKVFIGIQEDGAAGFTFRDAPQGEQKLPDELAQIYRDFINTLGPSVRQGGNHEDHSQGHALNQYPEMRKAQDAAVEKLKTHVPVVREVLKSSRDANDRGAAAWLLGYAPDKKEITPDLVDAARDPNSTVRNNATRALGAIAELAAAKPALGIIIEPGLFVDMLRSVTWTDRNKVSFLLDGMTETNGSGLLRTLRERALPEVIEMARWKSDGHAFPSVRLLGRIAGWEDSRTMKVWRDGGVEQIVAAATAK